MTTSNPFADEPQPAGTVRLQSAGDPRNPYAAPAGVVIEKQEPGIGLWRNGELLVIHAQAEFPDRCIITNEPARFVRKQKLAWSYAVDITHRYLYLRFGVCDAIQQHFVRRRGRWILVALACALPGLIALLVVYLGYFSATASVVMMLSFVGTAFLFERAWNVGNVFSFHSVKGSYFWLKGPQKPFLDSLPEWTVEK